MENQSVTTKPHRTITIDSLHTLKVYFDPLRTRIMHELAHEPRTVHQVAARQFTISRALLTFDPVGKNDSLEYMLDGVFGASHRDIRKSVATGRIDLNATPPHPNSLLARKFLLRLNDEQATNFQCDLDELLLKYQSYETSTADPYYSCLLALYRSSVPYESFDDSDCIETE